MSNDLALVEKAQDIAQKFDAKKMALLRMQLAPDLTDDEFTEFAAVCITSGLNPVLREIYAIKRGGKMTIQTGIDGYRKLAHSTGRYHSSRIAWCGEDGVWRDVWLSDKPPMAAKCLVGTTDGGQFEGIAHWREFYARDNAGRPTGMWARMPANQLAKCAEAQALRRAFPAEFKGIYIEDEMHQADNPPLQPRGRAAARQMMQDGTMMQNAKGNPDPWMLQLKEQVKAWGRSMSDLEELFQSSPITVNAMRQWAAQLPQGKDPFDEACKWLRARMPQSESHAAVDPATGEIVIEGEAREVPPQEPPPGDVPFGDEPPAATELPFED